MVFGGPVGFLGRSPAAETGDIVVGADGPAAGESQWTQAKDVLVKQAVVLMPFAFDADRKPEELGGTAVHQARECGQELLLSDGTAREIVVDLDIVMDGLALGGPGVGKFGIAVYLFEVLSPFFLVQEGRLGSADAGAAADGDK